MNAISKHQCPETTTSDQENTINQTPTPTSKEVVDIESIVYGFGSRRNSLENISKIRTPSSLSPRKSKPWPSPSSVTSLKFENETNWLQFFPKVNPQQQQQDGKKSGYNDDDDDRNDNDDSAESTFDSSRSKRESEVQVKIPRGIGDLDGKFQLPDDGGNCNRQEREQDGVTAEYGKILSESSNCVSNDIDTSAETKCQPVQSDPSELRAKEGNEIKEAIGYKQRELLQGESDQLSELKTTIDPIDVATNETFSSGEDQNIEVRSVNQDREEDSIANENGFMKVEQMTLEDKDTYLTDLDNLIYRHKEAPSNDEEDTSADISKSNEDDKVRKSNENHSFALGQPEMELTTSDDTQFRNETAQNALLKEPGSPAPSLPQAEVEITAEVTSLCQSDHSVSGKDVGETHLTTDEEQKRTFSSEKSSLEALSENTFSVEGVEDDGTATEEGASEDVISVTDEEVNATDEVIAEEPKISLDLQPIENDDEAVFDEENENQMRKFSIEVEQTEKTKDELENKGAETNEEEHLVEETSHTSSEEYSSNVMGHQFSDDMIDPLQQSKVNIPKAANDYDPSQIMTDQAEVEVTQSCSESNDEDEVFYGSADFHDTGKLRKSAAEDTKETDANETNEDNKHIDEKIPQDCLKVGTEQELSWMEEYYDKIGGLVAKKVSFEEDNTNEDDRRQLSGGESSKVIETSTEQSSSQQKPRQRPQSPSSMSFRSVKEIWEERISRNIPSNIEPEQKSKQYDAPSIEQNAKQNEKEEELESPSITAALSTKAEHLSPHRAYSCPIESVESGSLCGSSIEKSPDAVPAPKSKSKIKTIITKGPVYSCTSMRAIVLNKWQKTFSVPANIAPMPNPNSIVAKGPIYSRTSLRTIVLKKWNKSFFVQYGPTTFYLFRSEEDFGDWLQNPYLSQKQRDYLVKLNINFLEEISKPNVRGYKVTDLKAKVYERNGPKMHNFKLEKWMDAGPGIAAAFASPQEEEVTKIRNVISNCLRKCPEFALY